jgi:leucyl aminopeptidase (aminopeptidase T)
MLARWKEASDQLGAPTKILVYEETGRHGATLPQRGILLSGTGQEEVDVQAELARAQVLIGMTEFSATGPLKLLAQANQSRGFSMPGVEGSMEQVMSTDHSEFPATARRLKELLDPTILLKLRFTTATGITELIIDKEGRPFHISDGTARVPGEIGNYPGAEVYVSPREGTEEYQSKTQGYFPVFYGTGVSDFTMLEVNNNLIINVDARGADSNVYVQRLIANLARMPGNRNVAELGLGLNENARTELDVPLLEREKALGIHIAYGQNSHFGGLVGQETADLHQDEVLPRSNKNCIVHLYAKIDNGWQEVTW